MTMKTLEKNVINVWGDDGKSWFEQLPKIIAQLSKHWSLSDITPIDNMSYNYLAKAKQIDNTPVVLKVSCDKQLIQDEYRALKYFNGQGSIKVLDIHSNSNALLLEQGIPGHLLKSEKTHNIKNTINLYSEVVKTLALQTKPSAQHTHVKKWCNAIGRINDDRIKPHYIIKAKELSHSLLNSVKKEYLCHGDLHLENIIYHDNKWLSIDPKGIIAEMTFEAAAFDLIDKKEWSEPETIKDKIISRISLLANTLEINQVRLLSWVFLRVIISAQWFIQDQGDPNEMLNLASILYPLLNQNNQHDKSHTLAQSLNITPHLASRLIADQFPEYAHLPITSVKKQGHDNRTYRLGDTMLIRMPTAGSYALKVSKEQELLPRIKPYLTVAIPEPIKMGHPSSYYPFHFSIYKWLQGSSANSLRIDESNLEALALQLANFLKELQALKKIHGPAPDQHNWWRGDHVSVYDDGARKQIHALSGIIDKDKAIELWEQACKTRWHKDPVWIHGDFASGNLIIKDGELSGVIDFGGMGVGDPACDLVIAWTLLHGKSRKLFKKTIELDDDTWVRAKAWALWKATYELCQIQDKNSHGAFTQKKIIEEVLK